MARPPALIAAALLASIPAVGHAQGDLAKFEGTWSFVSYEEDGMVGPSAEIKLLTVVFDDDRYELKRGATVVESGSMKLDAAKDPKAVEFKILKGDGAGKTQLGIYAFEGEKLKICVSIPAGSDDRPKAFEAKKDSRAVLMVLKKTAG